MPGVDEPDAPAQDQPPLDAPSGLATVAGSVQAGGAVIAVFDDTNYVDSYDNTGSESDNLQAGLAAMGHTVVPFTGIDYASWYTALAGANVAAVASHAYARWLATQGKPAPLVDQGS